MNQEIPIRKKKASVSTSSGEGSPVTNTPVPPSPRKVNGTNSTAGSSARPMSIDDLELKTRGKKKPYLTPKAIQKLKVEAEEMRKREAWNDFKAGHWIALYAALHERVYGFYPTELESGTSYAQARLGVHKCLNGPFKGNGEMMADFIRWTWVREQERETWRRNNNQGGQRIGWKLQFSSHMVSDYRLDRTRKA